MINSFFRSNKISIALLVVLLGLSACTNPQTTVISLAAPTSVMSSLVWLTQERGYFDEQGIQLDLTAYPSGKRALNAMIQGKTDLAITAETPFVIASFKHDKLRLYATLGQSDNEVRILARKDHGILQPRDLIGKTIATQQGSAVHFFLTSFLLRHRIDASQVKIKFFKVEHLAGALTRGEVDAISMRDPVLTHAESTIGKNKLVLFSEPGLYTKSYNLVGFSGFNKSHPGSMVRILSALNKAATYVEQNPQQSIASIAMRLRLPQNTITSIWPHLRLQVTLNQGLLTTLQEEAHWAIASGQVPRNRQAYKHGADFWNRLNSAPLSTAVPDAVGLIGLER